jgi:hydroxyacylglutathione hydrolase
MPTLIVHAVPCLKDNYAYLIRSATHPGVYVVDPSEAAPVLEAIDRSGGGPILGILATHHHADHVGGVEEVVRRADAAEGFVAAHQVDRGRVPRQSAFVDVGQGRFAPSGLQVFGRPLLAMHIPGHTRGAIAWGIPGERDDVPADVFTGDTLFGAGCGRLFEGTPAEMHASLQALTALPGETRLWFGHEYTASNLRFAAAVDAGGGAVAERQAGLSACTTPTTVALERATNPFVRSSSVEELAERRAAKDRF